MLGFRVRVISGCLAFFMLFPVIVHGQSGNATGSPTWRIPQTSQPRSSAPKNALPRTISEAQTTQEMQAPQSFFGRMWTTMQSSFSSVFGRLGGLFSSLLGGEGASSQDLFERLFPSASTTQVSVTGGEVRITESEPTTPPIASIIASPPSVERGDQAKLHWGSIATKSCLVLDDHGREVGKGVDGTATVGPLSTTTIFYITCQTSDGEVTESTTLFVR